jgi:hypothetical protein
MSCAGKLIKSQRDSSTRVLNLLLNRSEDEPRMRLREPLFGILKRTCSGWFFFLFSSSASASSASASASVICI